MHLRTHPCRTPNYTSLLESMPELFTHPQEFKAHIHMPLVIGAFPHGLGDVTSAQINGIATVGAQTTVGILSALQVGAFAVPGVGVAIAGLIAVGSLIAQAFKGCGDTCVEATTIANQVEEHLKTNLATYQAAPVHYASLQAAALNNFDTTWNALTAACGNSSLGAAGQRCISERQRGGTAPWCPKPGGSGCDWFILYRDPIADDPTVVPDPTANTGPDSSSVMTSGAIVSGDSSSIVGGMSTGTLLLLALGVFLMMSGSGGK